MQEHYIISIVLLQTSLYMLLDCWIKNLYDSIVVLYKHLVYCTGFGFNFREVDVGEFMWDYSLPGQSTICRPRFYSESWFLLINCEAFSVVNRDCLQGNYTGYDLSWVTSICTIMNTNKSPSFQKFKQFINSNNNT